MRPRVSVRRAAAAVGTMAVLVGCTSEPAARPDPPPATPSSSASPDGEPPDPATTEPLVLAVPATRPAVGVTEARARRIAAGRAGIPGVTVLPASEMDPTMRAVLVDGIDPLRRPAAYPLRTAGPEPGAVTTLTVVGDIMLGRGVARAWPGDDPVAPLRPLGRHLAAADLTVGNLESTLSGNGPPGQGDDSFAAAPGVVPGLLDLGVDAVSLANNHTGDFGDVALLETVAELRDGGLPSFGAGRDLAAAGRAVVLRSHGLRFGFLGFNAIGETPPAGAGQPGALSVRMPPRTGPLNRGDLTHVLGLVRRLERRADVVVVLPHWGTQYTHVAEPVQTRVGRRLVDAGADLVAGGHPHWVQGLERYGDAVIAHSLGNLVFDMDFMEQTMEGVTLTATFWGDRLMAVELTPYRMDERFAPHPVAGPEAADILGDVWSHGTGPFRSP